MIYELREFLRNITRGEIIITCIAFVVWTTICIFINMSISNAVAKNNEVYYKAIQIDNDENLFEYAMKTNAGNALVYGTGRAVDAVSDEKLNGKYLAIKVHIDKYVQKVRYEDIMDEDGKVIGQRAVPYEEWDSYRTVETHANTINFLGKDFPYSKLMLSNYTSLKLDENNVKEELKDNVSINYIYPRDRFFHRIGDLRYRYSVIPLEQNLTVLADLRDNSMYNVKSETHSVDIHYNETIDEVMDSLAKNKSLPNIVFCIIWYIVFVVATFAFVISRNKWADC